MPVCPHIETSQLICKANQLTGFYMRATQSFNGLSEHFKFKQFADSDIYKRFKYIDSKKLFKNIDSKKSTDIDKILPNLVKTSDAALSKPLCGTIINSLLTG